MWLLIGNVVGRVFTLTLLPAAAVVDAVAVVVPVVVVAHDQE